MSSLHLPFLPSNPATGLAAASGGAGDGDGGDDPSKRFHSLKPTGHQVDASDANVGDEPPPVAKRRRRVPDGPLQCPVCARSFKSAKALHGHMRCHPERDWRGMSPPSVRPAAAGHEKEVAASLILLSEHEESAGPMASFQFQCKLCKSTFNTRQALGGHRASHRSKKGCYVRGKEAVVGGRSKRKGEEKKKKKKKKKKKVVMGGRGGKTKGQPALDLNLPPPPEEDDDDSSLSARSDA